MTAGEVTDPALMHPAPGYVTVRLYTPLDAVVVGVITAVVAVPVVLYPLGPLQLYEERAPVPDVAPAVSVNVPPAHNALADAVTPLTVGIAFTVTPGEVTDVALVHPEPG